MLFLRSTSNTPDKMKIEITASTGSLIFDILVMKVKNYSLDEIFHKKLLFLLSFYIFSHESRFKEYNDNMEMLEALKAEYAIIMNRLDTLLEQKLISAYTRKTIIEMSSKVLENISAKYDNVRKGVKSVMGVRILEHEAKTILEEGKLNQARETSIFILWGWMMLQ